MSTGCICTICSKARAILDGLSEGKTDPVELAKKAKGTLRSKIPDLERALWHPLSDDQRELLQMHLRAYDSVDAQVAETELKLTDRTRPYAEAIAKLDPIPGINPLAAITLLAETGVDMTVYRNEHHLTAIAGLAPGNAISSDKRRRISVRKGNHYLKRICVQIAWAASRKKDSFLRLRFLRLQSRIGRNKAIIAVARQILILVFHVLSSDRTYKDLGTSFYDSRNKDRAVQRYTRRLAALGFVVALTNQDHRRLSTRRGISPSTRAPCPPHEAHGEWTLTFARPITSLADFRSQLRKVLPTAPFPGLKFS